MKNFGVFILLIFLCGCVVEVVPKEYSCAVKACESHGGLQKLIASDWLFDDAYCVDKSIITKYPCN